MKRKAHIVSFEIGCGPMSCFSTPGLLKTSVVVACLLVDAGAEGMQDTGDVGVLLGSTTKWLHHQPCLQLGGPCGSERLPSTGRAGGQPEEGGRRRRKDGKNLKF